MATQYTQRSYTETDRSKKARQALEDHALSRPDAYESAWQAQMNQAMQELLNRQAFSYDFTADPMYGLYRDNYVNQGRMAMMDTMGQAAQLTGGYGNSYAALAGQQAYQGHLQNLNAMIPELTQLALDAYDRESQNMLNRYGILADRENLDYGRYQDGLSQWNQERDYLAGRYDAQQGFDYSAYRDMVGDDQWMAAFDEDIRRYDYEHKLGEFVRPASSEPEEKPATSGGAAVGGKKPEEKGKNSAGTRSTSRVQSYR